MSNANLLITLLVIFSSPLSMGQQVPDKGSPPTQEVQRFQPHMLDHPYKGCPTNSLCTKKLGQIRSLWLASMKGKSFPVKLEKFRRKYGMPLKVWTRDTVIKDEKLIVWDSFCPKHNPKPNTEGVVNTAEKIYIAEAWARDFSEVQTRYKEGLEVLLNRVYLLKDKEQVVEYLIPRSEAPLLLSGDKLYFTVEEEGAYFGLWVSPDKKVSIDQTYLPKNFPYEVECPKTLEAKFKTGLKNENLFQGHFCKAIWDQSKKKFFTLAIGWSCN